MVQSERLVFTELTLETQEWVTKKLREDGRALCEYSFASNYAWSPYFALRVALESAATAQLICAS